MHDKKLQAYTVAYYLETCKIAVIKIQNEKDT